MVNKESLKIRILLLSGSLHYPSHTITNLKYMQDLLRKRGTGTYLWDLFNIPLPILNPRYYRNPHNNKYEVVRHLARLADLADAFIWGTPVYHNSFSGILKNALDNLNTQQFRNKPIALISNGAIRSNAESCDQLRIVARGLKAVVIPNQVMTVDSDFEYFQGRFVIINPLISDSFVRLAEELITYSSSLRQLRSDRP